jgi:hypothetical protein
MCVSEHLPVTPLHCLVEARDALEKIDLFSFASRQRQGRTGSWEKASRGNL